MSACAFAKVTVGAALALAVATGSAYATPGDVSFDITGIGGYSVNTSGLSLNGDITNATTKKILPGTEIVSEVTGDSSDAGIVLSSAVTFSDLTLNTTVGPDAFTVSVGNLTFSFTAVTASTIVATGPSTEGTINEQFNGTVTGGAGPGSVFVGETVSMSESCSQPGATATINCSDSVVTPGLPVPPPVSSPEPASIALLGAGLFGLGMLRRRRRS